MELLLSLNAALLGLALVQALIGILFFRPGPALAVFTFQVLVLTVSTVLVLGFDFEARILCAWFCVILFFYLVLLGVKSSAKGETAKR